LPSSLLRPGTLPDQERKIHLTHLFRFLRPPLIAYLMLNTGMISGDPEEVLDLYFRQCALRVTTQDLAVMGATLANCGINPRTQEEILGAAEVRDVLTLMMSCGMYDYAGEWSYDVGLPAKSGVSGGLIAVLPGQLSVAIWSPPLDPIGNTVRGVEACRRMSQDFGLHLFMNAATVEDVVRRTTTANLQHSLRTRNPRERDILAAEGYRIALVELQGALYFASSERMLRELDKVLEKAEFLVLDVRRLNSIDPAAERVINDYLAHKRSAGIEVSIAEINEGQTGTWTRIASSNDIRVFTTVDAALESNEEMLLESLRQPFDHTKFSLDNIDLFKGLSADQLHKLEASIHPMQFDAGERIFQRGEQGQMFFVIARGSVSVFVPGFGANDLRVGCIGPGQFFGEMAVLGDGVRSADVVADERLVCYGLTSQDLQALTAEDPVISSTILANMAREFAERVRRSNEMVSSLK
ncbi:glutaminase, partial [Marivita geojedonensis]|uniref:glutaminase n=2 Tax=Marivita geojedonensis TaxID=1123756 RepID=UPI0011B26A7B